MQSKRVGAAGGAVTTYGGAILKRRVAARVINRGEITRYFAQNDELAMLAAANPGTLPDVQKDLYHHRNDKVIETLAENRSIAFEVAKLIALGGPKKARVALAKNLSRSISEPIQSILLSDVESVRVALAGRGNLDHDVALALAAGTEAERIALAGSEIHHDVQLKLSDPNQPFSVRKALASSIHPYSEDVQGRLLQQGDEIRRIVAGKTWTLARDIAMELASGSDHMTNMDLAGAPNVHPDALFALAEGTGNEAQDRALLTHLANRRYLPPGLAGIILERGPEYAGRSLAKIGPVSLHVGAAIWLHHDHELSRIFAARRGLNDELIELFMTHPDATVREALASNRHIPGRYVLSLAADPDPLVSGTAKWSLRYRRAIVRQALSRKPPPGSPSIATGSVPSRSSTPASLQ